jgi:hypothetical protein
MIKLAYNDASVNCQMPRLNKVTLTDRRYSQIFVSKSEDVFIPPELDSGERVLDINVGETYPEVNCTTIDQDCNWFLAAGTIKQTIPTCQLGLLDPVTPLSQPATIDVIFPGSVTYEVRPGKVKRLGFKCWAEKTTTILSA